MTKRGILTNGDYNRNGIFGNNSFKVCQKLNEMTNEACWLLAMFTKMTNLAGIANLARSNEWLVKNSNEMAKNGLLVIRDFYEDGKFWRKWQIWEEYMKGLNKIQMRWQIRLPWQLLSFRKRQIFNKNGEFDKGWSDVWQKLTNELTNWESMWKTGYHLRLNLEWSLI